MDRQIDLSFIPAGKERDDFLRKLVATPKEDRQALMEATLKQYGQPLDPPTVH